MANLKEIIVRYESEEEEFTRELEEMREKLSQNSSRRSEDDGDDGDGESDVPQDPQPILSVLCDLVDEIGTLRNENRRLKTRLSLPRPRSRQTVVERMSALLDASGSLFPRLKRSTITNSSPSSARIAVGGARERLSTPPPKDLFTTSSISTDFSSIDSSRGIQRRINTLSRPVPLVQPEASDSDFDENVYEESTEDGGISSASESNRKARRDSPRGSAEVREGGLRREDQSLSDVTSPSSASSSRDVSLAMTTSRSSFLEILGMKKRRERPSALTLLGMNRGNEKKRRRRRASDEGIDGNVLLDANGELIGRKRENNNNKRQSCRFTLNDEHLTDEGGGDISKHNSTGSSCAPSPLPSSGKSDDIVLNHLLSRHEHEKDNLKAEIEELKTRNSRILHELREKSMLIAHVQGHSKNLEKQVEQLRQRCALSDAVDKLSLGERMNVRSLRHAEKIEERLKVFDSEMQQAKAEANNAHQMTISTCGHERSCYRNCLEQIERLQKENFCLIRSRLIDSDDTAVRHRLAMMPSYDALYSFAMRVVRKLGVIRQALLERCTELSRTEVDLIAAQSTLLVTHAQIERLRLQRGKRRIRCSSWHGNDISDRKANGHLNFFLPFRLQSSRVADGRAAARILPKEVVADGIENEFISLFGHDRISSPSTRRHHRHVPTQSPPRSPPHIYQTPSGGGSSCVYANHGRLQRRPSGSNRSTRWPTPQQVLAAAARNHEQIYHGYGHRQTMKDDGERDRGDRGGDGGDRASKNRRRPVSFIEGDCRLSSTRNEGRRRSQRGDHNRVGSGGDGHNDIRSQKKDEKDKTAVRAVASMQDVSHPRTPNTTPLLTRRLAPNGSSNTNGQLSRHAWNGTNEDNPTRDDKRAPSRLERSRPVQNRSRPSSHLQRSNDKRGPTILSGSWEQDILSGGCSTMTSSKSPPTSPKSSRLPLLRGPVIVPPPQPIEPVKGLSWLSKLKHYKNSAK